MTLDIRSCIFLVSTFQYILLKETLTNTKSYLHPQKCILYFVLFCVPFYYCIFILPPYPNSFLVEPLLNSNSDTISAEVA